MQKGDAEIYQSINDIESYMKAANKESGQVKQKECQYSTPTNVRVLDNAETPINVQNYSKMQLLDDEDGYESPERI